MPRKQSYLPIPSEEEQIAVAELILEMIALTRDTFPPDQAEIFLVDLFGYELSLAVGLVGPKWSGYY